MTTNVSAATSAAAATTRWRRPAVSGLSSARTARGTKRRRPQATATLAGRKNHQQARQSIATVSRPPTTGPTRFAIPELAPQKPSAAPRRSGGNPERRGAALGFWGASSGMANLVGPVVGGLLTVAIDWRACWWFFLPASVAVAWGLRRFVPRAVRADESPETAGLRQRVVAAAALVAALTFVVMIGAFYLAQQYLQVSAGYSALGAAAALTLIALLVGVAAPLAGRLADARGEGPTLILGF